jgi:hypothetical protein
MKAIMKTWVVLLGVVSSFGSVSARAEMAAYMGCNAVPLISEGIPGRVEFDISDERRGGISFQADEDYLRTVEYQAWSNYLKVGYAGKFNGQPAVFRYRFDFSQCAMTKKATATLLLKVKSGVSETRYRCACTKNMAAMVDYLGRLPQ